MRCSTQSISADDRSRQHPSDPEPAGVGVHDREPQVARVLRAGRPGVHARHRQRAAGREPDRPAVDDGHDVVVPLLVEELLPLVDQLPDRRR